MLKSFNAGCAVIGLDALVLKTLLRWQAQYVKCAMWG